MKRVLAHLPLAPHLQSLTLAFLRARPTHHVCEPSNRNQKLAAAFTALFDQISIARAFTSAGKRV